VHDVNGDGIADIVLGGNFDGVKPEIGRMAGTEGLVLLGDGALGFTVLRPAESGFRVPGQTRHIRRVNSPRGVRFVVARNNDAPLVFSLDRP
jgi:enediyne biosynthesis protein E4